MKAAFFFFGQALKSAAANGASDIIVSLLLMKLAGKIKKGEGSTLKNLGASLGLNAAQTIGGNAIRETTDNMIMGEKSHYESQLRRYIQQQGLSREEAEKAVLLDELRATGSIAPFVSGLMLYGASWGMRMLDDVNILRQMHEYVPPEKNFDPDVTPYTQEDFRIAQILQDEAPKKTFEDDSNDGIMGKTDAGKSIDTPKQSAFSSIPSYLDISDGKVGGKVPIEEYQSIRSRSVKNFDADSITLGKYTDGPDSYISRAGTNSSYFDLGNEWGIIQDKYELTDAEMFDYFNKPALDNAIAGRKTIRFSHNPLDYEGSFLADEWEYIKQQLNKSDKDLSFEGGFWYVK